MEALREHGLEQCAKQFILIWTDRIPMRSRKVLEGRDRPTALMASMICCVWRI